MLVLKILSMIASVIMVLIAISRVNEHCHKKFSYRFFTKLSFAVAAVATWATTAGYHWFANSWASGGDILNGMIIMIIGGLFAGGLIYYNIKMTDIIYGIGGSALQFALFVPLALASAFLIFLMLLGVIMGNVGTTPVRVVNK
jgi:hypothetical protein